MGAERLEVSGVWVSEHYWPDLVEELMAVRTQRLARAPGVVAVLALPAEQTAFAIHRAAAAADVRRVLGRVGLSGDAVGAGWLLGHPVVPASPDGGPGGDRPH